MYKSQYGQKNTLQKIKSSRVPGRGGPPIELSIEIITPRTRRKQSHGDQ